MRTTLNGAHRRGVLRRSYRMEFDLRSTSIKVVCLIIWVSEYHRVVLNNIHCYLVWYGMVFLAKGDGVPGEFDGSHFEEEPKTSIREMPTSRLIMNMQIMLNMNEIM